MFIRENADKPKERKLPMIPLSEDITANIWKYFLLYFYWIHNVSIFFFFFFLQKEHLIDSLVTLFLWITETLM